MNWLSQILFRHEPRRQAHIHLKAVLGAMFGVMTVGALALLIDQPLLMAPLGPTSVLLFAQADNPSSQPINVFGGYFISAVLGIAAETIWPGTWWAAVIAVGIAMGLMLLFRVTHPPAASVPLALLASPMNPFSLFGIMLAACVVLTSVAVVVHRLPPRVIYPRQLGVSRPAPPSSGR